MIRVNLYFGEFTEAVFQVFVDWKEQGFEDVQDIVECTLITLQELG